MDSNCKRKKTPYVPLLAEVPENVRLAPWHCLPDTVVVREESQAVQPSPPSQRSQPASSGTPLVCFQSELTTESQYSHADSLRQSTAHAAGQPDAAIPGGSVRIGRGAFSGPWASRRANPLPDGGRCGSLGGLPFTVGKVAGTRRVPSARGPVRRRVGWTRRWARLNMTSANGTRRVPATCRGWPAQDGMP